LRGLWPHVDAGIAALVHSQVRCALEEGLLAGGLKAELLHFSLGAKPPVLCGVRAYADPSFETADAVCADFDVRLASTEPNAVIRLVGPILPSALTLQLAALQLRATVRVSLRLLVASLPPFEALTVSIVGHPFVDFSLTALDGDLMALPGLESIVSQAVRSAIKGYVWPLRLAVPLTEAAAASGALHPRARGALLVRICAARKLPITDASTMSTDPYMRALVEGQAFAVQTETQSRTRRPQFAPRQAVLPVTDLRTQTLSLELWDANSLSSDELVATHHLSLGDALGDGVPAPGGPPATFSAWLKLERTDVGLIDVSGQIASAGKTLRRVIRAGRRSRSSAEGGPEALVERACHN
jgi:Ca2+-dependent lipid-binding protein